MNLCIMFFIFFLRFSNLTHAKKAIHFKNLYTLNGKLLTTADVCKSQLREYFLAKYFNGLIVFCGRRGLVSSVSAY